VIVNASDTPVWRWDSAPFGDTIANEQPGGGATPAFSYSLRFPGQQYDSESGLHYNYFRDYEPGAGRYVQSDPIGLRGGLSAFGYAGQSSMAFVDSLGLIRQGTGGTTPTTEIARGKDKIPKPPTGRGAVPLEERDPKRNFSECDKRAHYQQNGGTCDKCLESKPFSDLEGHHGTRWADGGRSVPSELYLLCIPCHDELHRP
jgi:RHS repeat-associated protein